MYTLPREHLVFIRLFKNPPQPLRPDRRVACIEAHCLPAGLRSDSTHTSNLIFPHKDNRAVAGCRFTVLFPACALRSSSPRRGCYKPGWRYYSPIQLPSHCHSTGIQCCENVFAPSQISSAVAFVCHHYIFQITKNINK